MSGDSLDNRFMHPGPTHIGDECMPQVVEGEILNFGFLTSGFETAPHLVIIDADLPDTAPLELVQKLLMVNAMANTAVVSPLSDEEFHEDSEGLGILSRLTEKPGENDAATLLVKLKRVLGVMG